MANDKHPVSQQAEKPTPSPRPEATRVFWLDNLRALFVCLVIFGHLMPESPLKRYFSSFTVPLFFFVSGCSFDRSKYDFGQFVRRRIRTLVIPYLFFATVSFLFWFFIVRNVSIRGTAWEIDPMKPLVGILYGIGSGEWRLPINIALWFLPCLFVAEVVFYSVRNRFLLVAFAIIGHLVTFLPFRLPWSADVAFMGVVFYGMGYFYKDTRISPKVLPVLFGLSFVSCFLNKQVERVDVNVLAYGNVLYFYISAISGVLLCSALSKFTKRNRVLEYLGSNTIILIGLVEIAWFMVRGIWYVLFGSVLYRSGPAFALAATAVSIISTVPAIYCINRWFPFLVGRSSRRTLGHGDA